MRLTPRRPSDSCATPAPSRRTPENSNATNRSRSNGRGPEDTEENLAKPNRRSPPYLVLQLRRSERRREMGASQEGQTRRRQVLRVRKHLEMEARHGVHKRRAKKREVKKSSIKHIKGMVEALRKSTAEADQSLEERLADIDAILVEVVALHAISRQTDNNRELGEAGQDIE